MIGTVKPVSVRVTVPNEGTNCVSTVGRDLITLEVELPLLYPVLEVVTVIVDSVLGATPVTSTDPVAGLKIADADGRDELIAQPNEGE